VNLASGGRTPVAAISAALTIALVVTVLTAPLTLLPQAALGAVLAFGRPWPDRPDGASAALAAGPL
jgi:hypothetical protein